MVIPISPEELRDRLRDRPETLVLLDVREADEREAARIEPSIHIPMNDVPPRRGELPTDRLLVVYCHHGSRSMVVASYLEQEGLPEPANLTGGIEAWSLRVDPDVPRY